MSRQYIYQVEGLTKKHGPREVLKEIWLSFYPGAKIGVLGRNGSGKSTLLRIMAGQDKDCDGEARLTNGFSVGYLSQEPQLNQPTVWENLQEAIRPRRKVLDRYNEISGLLFLGVSALAPNFEIFDLSRPILTGAAIAPDMITYPLVYGFMYTSIMLLLSFVIFNERQF